MKIAQALLFLALTATSHSALAQWQWVDQYGRKVFSDAPPPASVPAKNILKRPNPSNAPKPAAEPKEAPSATSKEEPAEDKTPNNTDKELEAKKKKAQEAEAAKKKEAEAQIAKAKIENCARAKQAQASYQSGIRIARTAANGEKEYIDDATRAAELKRIAGIIAADCK